jgi:aquaporin Z
MAEMRRLAAEFVGTFALVFAGCGAIVADGLSGGAVGPVGIGLTFGLVVMAMIYAVGDVSGAHLNPAVTVGFWASGRFPGRRVVPYAAAQCAGAFAASGLLAWVAGGAAGLGPTLPRVPVLQAFVLELLLTFVLMFVILTVATGAKEVGALAGIAVGAVIALEALFAGPLTGASMNPARSLAPAVVGGTLSGLWIYLTAPVAGALLGVAGCRGVRGADCCTPKAEPVSLTPEARP